MLDVVKFLIGFLPWIAFGILAGPSLMQLEEAIVISLILTVVLGVRQLIKGYILTWGTLIFFMAMTILVLGYRSAWIMQHMGILAPATLAAIAWISFIVGKPFVLQFAQEHTAQEFWNSKEFISSCRYMTILWGCLFLISTGLAFAKFYHAGLPEWSYSILSIAIVVVGIGYTEWYKVKKRRLRESQ